MTEAAEPSPFEKFRQLAKRIVSVPKKEADKETAKTRLKKSGRPIKTA